MTAIKKTTSKTTKSPAPAIKPIAAKTGAKKKAVSASAAPAISAAPAARATTQPPVAVAPPPPAAAVTMPTIKVIETKSVVTLITARLDIGFGNTLYLRGEGPGLSWDKGVAMDCLGHDHWELALPESARPYAFKFLVNDLSWSTGADYTVVPGQSVTITPEF